MVASIKHAYGRGQASALPPKSVPWKHPVTEPSVARRGSSLHQMLARRSGVALRSGSPTHLLSRGLENGDQCAIGQLTNSCLRRWLITAVYFQPHTLGHFDAGVVTQSPHLM